MKFVINNNGAEIDDDDVLTVCGDSKLILMVLAWKNKKEMPENWLEKGAPGID